MAQPMPKKSQSFSYEFLMILQGQAAVSHMELAVMNVALQAYILQCEDWLAELLLVNLGFFMCHIYWSQDCQLSVLYNDRNGLNWLLMVINIINNGY